MPYYTIPDNTIRCCAILYCNCTILFNTHLLTIFLFSDLAKTVPVEVDPYSYDSPHTKTHLLLQAHFSRATLPCSDYYTDTKSVLDQSIRILQVNISPYYTLVLHYTIISKNLFI